MLDQQMEQALIAEARRAMITGRRGGRQSGAGRRLRRRSWSGPASTGSTLLLRRDRRQARRAARLSSSQLHGGGGFPVLFEEFGFRARRDGRRASPHRSGRCPDFDPAGFEEFATCGRARRRDDQLSRTSCPAACAAFAETDPQRRLQLLRQGFPDQATANAYAPNNSSSRRCCNRIPDLLERYAPRSTAITARQPTGWRCSACWRRRPRR